MYKKALLDQFNILIGFADVEELAPDDVDGGAGDLAVRDYYWDKSKQSFLPIKSHSERVAITQPLPMEVALCDFMEAFGHAIGEPLPPRTQEWVDWYRSTFDTKSPKNRVYVNGKIEG